MSIVEEKPVANKEATRQIILTPDNHSLLADFCGQFNQNLHQIETFFGVEISGIGNQFSVFGIPKCVDKACEALKQIYAETANGSIPTKKTIMLTLKALDVDYEHNKESTKNQLNESALVMKECTVKPRTRNQRHFLKSIQQADINFGIGPAGTGKTFLAVACAVSALEKELVSRIVLTRPAVEAGENLGFLPGDLTQKIDPYLRPLYDALYEMLGSETINRLISKGTIEIAPLAFMRGRTLNDSFVILDEGQNTTKEQMKMFLTRIGFGSRAVITGDITQVDLPRKTESGLRHALAVLRNINALKFTFFTSQDVVRHPLVQEIIEAYDEPQD